LGDIRRDEEKERKGLDEIQWDMTIEDRGDIYGKQLPTE